MWEKNKGTTLCDKSTVTYNVSTTQCEDGTIKCDVLVTWYNKLPISGYHTPKKRVGTLELPSFSQLIKGHISTFTSIYAEIIVYYYVSINNYKNIYYYLSIINCQVMTRMVAKTFFLNSTWSNFLKYHLFSLFFGVVISLH